MKRQNSVWIALTVIGVSGAIVGSSNAFGGTAPDPETASTYYSAAMSPAEISKLSQGTPGDAAPPCPAADVVTSLKEVGLPVGPCVPVPEKGHQVMVPLEEPTDDGAEPNERVCAAAFLRSTTPGAPNKIEGPCGLDASISDVELFVDDGGTNCARVTYVLSKAVEQKTDRICEGEKPTADGLALVSEVDER